MAAAAGPAEVDLVDLARGPVTLRAEALSTGLPLYESEPGAWANAQMAAILERWDTAWLRELDLHLMARPRSMTPATSDRDVVHQRLRLVRELLDDLEAYRGRTGTDLTADRTSRYVVERLLTAMVEVAASVNSHLAASSLGRAPATYRESFLAAAQAGWITDDTAAALAPSAGLRNIVIHASGAIDLDLVADAIGPALDGYAQWIEQIAERLTNADD